MSTAPLPVAQRNVSLRISSRPMGHSSPRSAGTPTTGLHEEDFDIGQPLEMSASSSRETSGRDASQRESNAILRLSVVQKAERFRTVFMLNLASVMERMDEQILPAVYAEIGRAFNATPTQLGYLTLSRALVQAFASPVGGIAGHYYDRIWVTTCGCFIWGTMTTGFALCTSITQGVFFWAINGIGLSLVIPNAQSCIADFYSANSRGLAFGALYVTSGLGAMAGSLYATNIGHLVIGGLPGWRFAFLSVAAASILIGGVTWLLGTEPRKMRLQGVGGGGAAANGRDSIRLADVHTHMLSVMRVPTFAIIVAQGIVGSIPWSGMVFLTLYFQLLGMSDFWASCLMALLLGSTALGGLLGGWVGDMAALKHPDHGRIAVCQISVAVGIPFSLLITKLLPHDGQPSTIAMYATVMVMCGLFKSWAAPACNNPIFAEIVPPHLRTLVYSFDRCFEGAIAACAAPLVGILAEQMFGFTGTAAPTGDPAIDLVKAGAIGNALLCFMIVPWTLCLVAYAGMHFTYPADRAAAQKEQSRGIVETPRGAEWQRLRPASDPDFSM